MTQTTDSKAQKDLSPDYRRLRFKKLIPSLLKEDFKIPLNHWVKDKVLSVDIFQEKKIFKLAITKAPGDATSYFLCYKHSHNSNFFSSGENFTFKTISELYAFAKERLKKDGLLTIEELMVRDIIV